MHTLTFFIIAAVSRMTITLDWTSRSISISPLPAWPDVQCKTSARTQMHSPDYASPERIPLDNDRISCTSVSRIARTPDNTPNKVLVPGTSASPSLIACQAAASFSIKTTLLE